MRYTIQKRNNSGFTFYQIVDTEDNCDVVATTRNYIAAMNIWCKLSEIEDETYATTTWSWEDVAGIKPEWSEEQCREWWEQNEKWFRDVITQYGNEVLSDVLN